MRSGNLHHTIVASAKNSVCKFVNHRILMFSVLKTHPQINNANNRDMRKFCELIVCGIDGGGFMSVNAPFIH